MGPMGQPAFFGEYLKRCGLFDPWVGDCPLYLTSPNAPSKRDVLGTLLLSVLAVHRRYAHITCLRSDGVSPGLLGMKKVVSEESVRCGFRAGAGIGGLSCCVAACSVRPRWWRARRTKASGF